MIELFENEKCDGLAFYRYAEDAEAGIIVYSIITPEKGGSHRTLKVFVPSVRIEGKKLLPLSSEPASIDANLKMTEIFDNAKHDEIEFYRYGIYVGTGVLVYSITVPKGCEPEVENMFIPNVFISGKTLVRIPKTAMESIAA